MYKNIMLDRSAIELLNKARVSVDPETYSLISLSLVQWNGLLQDPDLSPRMTTPFMIFFDGKEVTLLLDDIDFTTVRHAIRDAKIEKGFRLLTFDLELQFNVVGFIALITNILAEYDIPVITLSAFSRDHLLIKQDDLGNALKALGPHVAELC